MENAAMKAYSYIRFSAPEQEKGDSWRRQFEYSQQVAAKFRLPLDDQLRFTDRGLSAYKGDHRTKGALGAFLKLVDEGKIQQGSVLIIEALDRLSREEMLEAIHLLTGILLKGIDIYTAMDDKHFSRQTYNLADLIISATKLQQGHEESEKKSIRLGKAWENKRKEVAEKGYKLTARCPYWLRLKCDKFEGIPEAEAVRLRLKEGKFEVIPEIAVAINKIFRLKLEGYGSGRIAYILNQDGGLKPKRGWRKSYVDKILRNRAVIGEYQLYSRTSIKRVPVGDPIPGYYPVIVETELFYQVQAAIQENKSKHGNAGGRNGKVSNLFGHMAICDYCGSPMAYVDKGPPPKGGSYLVCDRARRGLGCKRTYIRYNQYESLILSYCKGLDAAEILPGNAEIKSEVTKLRDQLQALEGEAAQVQRKTINLVNSLEDADSPETVKPIKERIKALQGKTTALEARREALTKKIAKLSHIAQDAEKQLYTVQELIGKMSELDGQERIDLRLNFRSHLRRLIEQINFLPEEGQVGLIFKTGDRRFLIVEEDQIIKFDISPGASRVPGQCWRKPCLRLNYL
jgi:DNA invertase Pin-like site-specific DNA recombinase